MSQPSRRRPRVEVDSRVNFTSGVPAAGRVLARLARSMSARPSIPSRVSAAVSSVVARDRSQTAPPPLPAGGADPAAPPGRGPKIAVGVLLALILGVGLWIRLRHNDYGLPFVYNYDESEHFTNRSVKMFGGNLDPGYYQNPSGYTYLMYLGLRAWFAVLGLGHLEFGAISKQFVVDPTPIWDFARTLTALLAMAGVVATFFVARRLDRKSTRLNSSH